MCDFDFFRGRVELSARAPAALEFEGPPPLGLHEGRRFESQTAVVSCTHYHFLLFVWFHLVDVSGEGGREGGREGVSE
jgi:hypothetical protein